MKPKYLPLHCIRLAFMGISAGAIVDFQTAQATSQTWDGAASGVWDTSALNWAGAAFTSSNDALFTGTPTNNVTTATGLTIGAITLNSSYTGSVTLTGANTVSGATTISGGKLLVGNATSLGTSAITLSGGTLGASTGTVSMTNVISAATSTNSTIGGPGQGILQLEVGSTLSGSGNIALASSFNIRGGNNTTFDGSGYTGTLTVNNGTTFLLQAGTSNKASTLNLSNAAVVVQTGGFIGYQHGGSNSGNPGYFKFGSLTGGGTLTSFGGGANSKISDYQIGSSTLADSTFSGTITQGVPVVSLTKVGSNMLTLSGTGNNYTGNTTINGGTLALQSNLGATAVFVNAASTSLKIGGNVTIGTTAGGSLTLAGTAAASSPILDLQDGTINTLTLANTTATAAGSVFLAGSGSSGNNSRINLEIGATADQIVVNNTTAGVARFAVATSGTIVPVQFNVKGLGNLSGTTQTIFSAGGAITYDNGNTPTLSTSGNNSGYVLAIQKSGNTLQLTETANTAPTTAYWKGTNDGVWNTFSGGNTNTSNFATDLAGTNANGALAGTTNVVFSVTGGGANSASTTLGQNTTINSLTFNNQATGSIGIGGSNTLTINAGTANGNTAGNGINVQSGSGNHTISSKVALGADQTWTVTDSGTTLTASNQISGGFALTKAGAGILNLSGANTYTGTTTVSAGKLVVSGSIGNSAVTVSNTGTTLASGSTGTIGNSVIINSGAILAAGDVNAVGKATVGTGASSLASGSIFSWDLTSNKSTSTGTRGTDYDALNVTSGGTLTVDSGAIFRVVLGAGVVADSFWQSNQSWSNIFSGTITGSFTNSLLQVVNSAGATYDQDSLFTGSGYGFSVSGTTLTWSAVPEPTSALAGLLIAAGLLRRRRKN